MVILALCWDMAVLSVTEWSASQSIPVESAGQQNGRDHQGGAQPLGHEPSPGQSLQLGRSGAAWGYQCRNVPEARHRAGSSDQRDGRSALSPFSMRPVSITKAVITDLTTYIAIKIAGIPMRRSNRTPSAPT